MVMGKVLLNKCQGENTPIVPLLRLQKEMYEANWDMEGYLEPEYSELVYLEPVILEAAALPAMTTPSDNDSNSTQELNGEYDSDDDSDVDIHMEDFVDTLDSIDLDGCDYGKGQ